MPLDAPRRDIQRMALAPATFVHEHEKIAERWPAAQAFIQQHGLNEVFGAGSLHVGLVVQGGLYNSLMRALELLGLADVYGRTPLPIYVMNVVYPVVDLEVQAFFEDKDAVLMLEEGQNIERPCTTIVEHRPRVYPLGISGVRRFLQKYAPSMLAQERIPQGVRQMLAPKVTPIIASMPGAALDDAGPVLARPPSFCTGCPERPVFTALKMVEQVTGKHHISADIGCHQFAALAPFDIGATSMGYGLGAAGAAALNTGQTGRRSVSIMGDGGFWHNGLTSGVGNAVFNQSANVIVLVDNGYSAATGGQDILSSRGAGPTRTAALPIAEAVRGIGVKWIRSVARTYDLKAMKAVLLDALTSQDPGPKVVIAQSECMLNKQRRTKPQVRERLKAGARVVQEKFGVDADTCTGDHSCIRLSGCPSLTIRDNPDPLRQDPVAAVESSCVACGHCGEWCAMPAGSSAAAAGWPMPSLSRYNAAWPHGRFDMRTEANMRPLKIAVLAMGGEGGAVLADWIVQTAERQGFHAQSTSVPGVAQRTGATIYYVEILPVMRGTGAAPIFALMPTPGDVDVVIASELMEAARAVQRGLVTPDRTLLIASSPGSSRSQEQDGSSGDGRMDSGAFRAQCERAARQLRSPLGALAAAGLAGLSREMCEQSIREGGVGVATSLNAFAAGFSAATDPKPVEGEADATGGGRLDPRLQDLAQRIKRDYPRATHPTLHAAIAKISDYQCADYARLYLDKVDEVHRLDAARGDGSCRLTNEVARHLALWMSFEDLARVAELKIRKSRFERVRREIGAAPGQIVRINEYFHPRLEEIADILPPALGRFVSRSRLVRSVLGPLTKNGRVVRSSSLVGFLLLYGVSRFKAVRRYSLRYQREMGEMSDWLARIKSAASLDYGLACEIAQCQRLIKGYSDTHARGMRNFRTIMSLLQQLPAADAASRLKTLREAALADEAGAALEAMIRSMGLHAPSPGLGQAPAPSAV
ncbi:hypothetical protein FQR65_LT20675 [Abscondita terminalis]|nr:hypothetical protein FQR65_LT20675 [Abscondita terminalis]